MSRSTSCQDEIRISGTQRRDFKELYLKHARDTSMRGFVPQQRNLTTRAVRSRC